MMLLKTLEKIYIYAVTKLQSAKSDKLLQEYNILKKMNLFMIHMSFKSSEQF